MEVDPDYEELVDLVADKDLDFEFPNSSVQHAKYVISKIIEKTQKNFFVYSRNLNNEVFNNEEILTSMKNNEGISIKILLENSDKGVVSNFKSKIKDIEVRQLKPQNHFYFIVSDSQRIRICSRERPHQARVNFNRKSLGEKLSKNFESLWDTASPI